MNLNIKISIIFKINNRKRDGNPILLILLIVSPVNSIDLIHETLDEDTIKGLKSITSGPKGSKTEFPNKLEAKVFKDYIYDRIFEVSKTSDEEDQSAFELKKDELVYLKYVNGKNTEFLNLKSAIESSTTSQFINYKYRVFSSNKDEPPFYIEMDIIKNLPDSASVNNGLDIKTLLAIGSNMLLGLSMLSSRYRK